MNFLTNCLHDEFSESSSIKSHLCVYNEVMWLGAETRCIQNGMLNMIIENLS